MTNRGRLSIYEIRDMALSSGRAVYTVQQLSNLIGKSLSNSRVYFSRLVDKGFAFRLLRGKITFVQNDYVIGTQLVEPSYISFDSALLFHDLTMQVPRNLQLATTVNSITYQELGLEYHRIPSNLFWGYERVAAEGSYMMVASAQKALIDGYYLNMYSLENLLEYGRGLDFSEVLKPMELFSGKGSKKIRGALQLLAQTE